ncbi:MAG TPA: tetratricopeptide repeat protein [Thermodesulfobacteriota bacterium]|nr:tetratricopeptide repeat protein [Thermodesulfobacteriota bacterium]
MGFTDIFFSKRFFISFAIVILISLVLVPFPLIGILGFEFSLIIAFIASFISVFISAEYINLDLGKKFIRGKRLSDIVSSVFVANFLLIAFPFVIGLLSSMSKDACYITEGIIFYILTPGVTVFFASSLGLLCGAIFPKRGFLIGSLVLLATVCFSLWKLYSEPPVFSYNPVFGFFPGPLYDEAIPITSTLIVYRLIVVCWGLFFLNILWLIRGFKYKAVGVGTVLTLFMLIVLLTVSQLKKEELGITYTRNYITENFLTASVETEHFVIYYTPGTPEARNIELIAGDHEWRYHQVREFLQVSSENKIRSYIYPDIRMRKKLMGAGETTIANPIHREIHLVYDSFPNPVLKHELVHVMSSEFGTNLLKISPKVGLMEGLAVAADWSGDEFTPHEWSKAITNFNSVPDMESIIGLGFWYAPASKSYTLMGSFVRYLIDSYGIQKFKTLYRTGDFSIYEKGADKLISEWKKFLTGIPTSKKLSAMAESMFSQTSIFQGRCPRRIADLRDKGLEAFKGGNFYEAKGFFRRALSFNQSDPILINSLAYAYYYDKDYINLIGIVDKPMSLPEVDKNILENLRGNMLWQSGKVQTAKAIFKSLQEETLPDDIKREIQIKLTSISAGGKIEDKIREYFSTRDRLSQVAILEEIIRDFPDYASAYYLLGRIFFNNGDYAKAAYYLSQAELLGLPSKRIRKENSRILGTSLFATGDYGGAIKRFEYIINMGKGKKGGTYDLIDRCKWMQSRKLELSYSMP